MDFSAYSSTHFSTLVDSLNHHHDEDTEQFYHPQKTPSCCPTIVKSFLHPEFLASSDLSSTPGVLPFLERHIKRIVTHVMFRHWLLSVSIVLLRLPTLLHVWLTHYLLVSIVWIYVYLFTCWRTSELFPVLAIMNRAFRNIHVLTGFQIFLAVWVCV